jgi:hypothetical protein
MNTTKTQAAGSGQPATSQGRPFQVRSDVHAGASADCSLGLQYWKSEYNRLKNLATTLGCI